jgi:plasmid stability protein
MTTMIARRSTTTPATAEESWCRSRTPERRAAQHNRSAEAEMRAILEAAVRPEDRLRLGTALSETSRKIGLTNADVEALEHGRYARPAEPMQFE